MAITPSRVARRDYALTISQIMRDIEAVFVRWGLPCDIETTRSAVYKRYDPRAYVGAWLIKCGNYPQLAELLSHVATPTFLRAAMQWLPDVTNS